MVEFEESVRALHWDGLIPRIFGGSERNHENSRWRWALFGPRFENVPSRIWN